jgi:hypothetical protein
VVLVAGTHGLATSSFDQPLENPDLRWLVRDPHSAWSASQAILLFGYGPEVPAGPGRPAGEFVLTDADQPPTGP